MNFGIQKSIRKLNRNPRSEIEEDGNRKYIQFFSIDKYKSEFTKKLNREDDTRKDIVEQRLRRKEHQVEKSKKKYEKSLYSIFDDDDDDEEVEDGGVQIVDIYGNRDNKKNIKKNQLKYFLGMKELEDIKKEENTLEYENAVIYDTFGRTDHFQNERDDLLEIPGRKTSQIKSTLTPFMQEEIKDLERSVINKLRRTGGW